MIRSLVFHISLLCTFSATSQEFIRIQPNETDGFLRYINGVLDSTTVLDDYADYIYVGKPSEFEKFQLPSSGSYKIFQTETDSIENEIYDLVYPILEEKDMVYRFPSFLKIAILFDKHIPYYQATMNQPLDTYHVSGSQCS